MADFQERRFIVSSGPAALRTLVILAVCFAVAFGVVFIGDYFDARRMKPGFEYRKDLSSSFGIALTAAGLLTIVLTPFVFIVTLLYSGKGSKRGSAECRDADSSAPLR